MKVIFLDFDGVLNCNSYILNSEEKAPFFLDDDKMMLLKEIINETGAKIVLSTSWREIWDEDLAISHELKNYFKSFDIEVYGKTDFIEYTRYKEIDDYVHKNNISEFCILDDMTGPWKHLIDHVILTNTTHQGLTEENVKEAIEMLKSKN